MVLLDFLHHVLPPNAVYVKAHRRSSADAYFKHITCHTLEEMAVSMTGDSYFTPAGFEHANDPNSKHKTPRYQSNIKHIKSLWLDIDPKNGLRKEHMLHELGKLTPKASIIVDSGNGYHVYFLLKEPLPLSQWQVYAEGLYREVERNAPSLMGDVSRWRDGSSLLRIPDTYNYKDSNNPKRISVVYPSDGDPHILTTTELESLWALGIEHAAPIYRPDVKTDSYTNDRPKPTYAAVLSRCALLFTAASSPERVTEELWYASLGALHGCAEGEEAAVEFSRGYSKFDEAETRNKYNQWSSQVEGYATCATLREKARTLKVWCGRCVKFKDKGGTSPIAGVPYTLFQGVSASSALDAAASSRAKQGTLGFVPTDGLSTRTQMLLNTPQQKPSEPISTSIENVWTEEPIHNPFSMAEAQVLQEGDGYIMRDGPKRKVKLIIDALPDETQPRVACEQRIPYIKSIVRRRSFIGTVSYGLKFAFVGEHDANIPGWITIRTDCLTARRLEDALRETNNLTGTPHFPELPPRSISHLAMYLTRMQSKMQYSEHLIETIVDYEGWETDVYPTTEVLPPFISSRHFTIDKEVIRPAQLNTTYGHPYRVDVGIPTYETLKRNAYAWAEGVREWANTKQGIVPFTAAMLSPFIAILPSQGSCLLVLHGLRGSFKSTSMQYAYSAWESKAVISTGAGVTNPESVTDRSTHLKYVAACVDEFPMGKENDSFIHLAQAYTQGKSRPKRSNKAEDSYGEIQLGRWYNLMMITGNGDPTQKLQSTKKISTAEGAARRYLPVEYKALKSSSQEHLWFVEHIPRMEDHCENYAGFYGPYFVSVVQKNLELFRHIVAVEVARVKNDLKTYSDTANVPRSLVGGMLAICEFSNRCDDLPLKFDTETLRSVLYASLETVCQAFGYLDVSNSETYKFTVDQLINYVRTNYSAVHAQLEYADVSVGRVDSLLCIEHNALKRDPRPALIYEYPVGAVNEHAYLQSYNRPLEFVRYWIRRDVFEQVLDGATIQGMSMSRVSGLLSEARMVANDAIGSIEFSTDSFTNADVVRTGQVTRVFTRGLPMEWISVPRHFIQEPSLDLEPL